jgi:hypothetical protein
LPGDSWMSALGQKQTFYIAVKNAIQSPHRRVRATTTGR